MLKQANTLILGIALSLSAITTAISASESKAATIAYNLRLIPLLCSDERSSKYHTERCVMLRQHMYKTLDDCENKRDGLLVRDEARNLYVCVKAKPLPTDISLSNEAL
ncbi:MAG TPA: hypothetical protein DCL26_01865 [Alteromonas australica]|nr:hypothetical protein [Alteromonas australica]HBY38429.1 hypothetical protein [Alteromonas sp.]|tara:strand:- start:501 stop:824 length:324 start_codon:yes stop_codon:yes gene_type:complete